MRILTIGIGGAGSRIVDQLYYQDRRSSVSCISSVVVDIDGNFLSQLRNMPEEAKIFFPALDPDVHFDVSSTVDVREIMSKIKKMDNIDLDAIMIFAGLGGNMTDIIPELTEEIRKSYFEPVFVVCTLPYLREGRAIAKKAADDLDNIEKCTDGVILFDNETWYKKIKASFETSVNEHGEASVKPSPYGRFFPDNPRDVYRMLNDKISRQIGLLLRAGEFNESGFESAEIVLDAGEILNTLKGNGMTAIGYAIEVLPINWRDTLERWRSENYFSEGSHKRATRIVALAKQAVYEDISIPCDLTSADKALVLIAGPSRELSMKGFQTVRKWIDSSIAGLEMRSGDYPVRNTRYVGIIIMLSGIHNIPRLEEVRKLREEYLLEEEERYKKEEESRILEEEEALLLSGRTAPEESRISEREVPQNTHAREYGYPEESYYGYAQDTQHTPTAEKPPEPVNQPNYSDQEIEDEAWELIGGYSSAPPKADYSKIHNQAPIIEDYGMQHKTPAENLDIDDFLENDSGDYRQTEESPVSQASPGFGEDYPGAYHEENSSISFTELLDDDDSLGFDENGEEYGIAKTAKFSDNAFSYIPDTKSIPEEDNISLTSPEFVKRQEYEEYKEEESEKTPAARKDNVQDDKIVISGKKEKKEDNNGINLPGRSSKTDLDMTRMTSVNFGSSPKDSIFGVKEIKGPGVPKEKSDTARVGETISIGSPAKRASDKSFSAGTFSGGSRMRPNDNAFSGGKVSGGPAIRPNDSTFSGGKVSINPNVKASDRSISGGKVSIRPNIRPKDTMSGGKIAMGSSAKKPVELMSGGIKTGAGIKPKELLSGSVNAGKSPGKPKELLSGGIKSGSGVKTKELLSGDIKMRDKPNRPSEPLSGGVKVGKNPIPGKKESPNSGQPKRENKKKSKDSSFSSENDEDLFWI